MLCAGAKKPTLSAKDEDKYGFCERSQEQTSDETKEGRRLKGYYGKQHYGKHYGKYGKFGKLGKHGKYGKYGKHAKYGKYWHSKETDMSPSDYYDSRSPSELYRAYYDNWYGEGAYDKDFPLDDEEEVPPIDGEFSMPEMSMPEFSVPVDPPFSIPIEPEPPVKFKPDPKFPPGKEKFPPKKGKPFTEGGRRVLAEAQPGLLRVVETAPELDLTIINVEDGAREGPSFSFGHQMTNGSYRILHSDVKSGATIPSGYYTIVPDRTPSGDFKKATCYGAPISDLLDRNGAVQSFDMVRLNI